MYRYRYINKHEQFGSTSYSLILSDLENIMPEVRIEKEFNISNDQIDDDFLYKEASREIQAAQQAYQIYIDNLPIETSDETSEESE